MDLSAFKMLYDRHHPPLPELFHYPKQKLYPLNINSSFPLLPLAPGNFYSIFSLCEFACSTQ